MDEVEAGFRGRVEALVRQIPRGRVMTYGQLAALCGNARAARIVGGIAHFGDPDLPWQRVVNKRGGLASGYPGGRQGHKAALEDEGIAADDEYKVAVRQLLWWPEGMESSEIPAGIILVQSSLVVIVGETASGKSALALELADRFGGEIICADSWTVYKGFDVGTAKPTEAEQARLPHHLLDVAEPRDGFNAVEFQRLANQAVTDITGRGKLPFLVGGAGLYIDSVIYDYSFLPPPPADMRQELNSLSLEQLQLKVRQSGLDTTGIDCRNKRRIIRLIENNGIRPTKQQLRGNTLLLGLQTGRAQLSDRITRRVNHMFEQGLELEVKALSRRYGWDTEAMKGIGYREFQDCFSRHQTLEQTRQRIISATIGLAKRQRTWFKRNNSIQWLTTDDKQAEAVAIITTHLNNLA